jgi:hypothetical protein
MKRARAQFLDGLVSQVIAFVRYTRVMSRATALFQSAIAACPRTDWT